ncbi:putative glycine betaine ABC transport system integral membrane protein [Nostocoides japonicum T1-X7]|uniref:Putative glycine betaine ABC transport system integral membrane protein n=1 Tax=Nostocoides japonicum T1-X7 TaxID=1194083 RepID=A0A077M5M9_9MICO|nr:ABC transporter permease subunit [Tetrasphaera japonica]CCH79474.1 putative glycine betaine ABC transport system integral membrane protein [Tetrasphaera japonica T1-X7]
MTATATDAAAPAPDQGPGPTLEEQPIVEYKNRRIPLKLAIIAAVWVLGWLLLRGKMTLSLPYAELNGFMNWLNDVSDKVGDWQQTNFFFHTVLGNIVTFINDVVAWLQKMLSTPPGARPTPEIGWLGVTAILGWVAFAVAGWRSTILVVVTLLLFNVLDIWTDGIDLLIVTGLSVLVSVAIGLPLGIWMARRKRVSAFFTPILDIMQTMPSFAYLAPLALFFGIGPACAIVITLIYALPPVARITEHAIHGVSESTVEASRSLGVTKGQLLRRVQLPMARRTIVVGINQCTLAALAMATVTALVNGPGLGQDVIQALQALNVGDAFVAGSGIVLAAIMLDRTTTAASERAERAARRGSGSTLAPRTRQLLLLGTAVVALVLAYLSHLYLWAAQWPDKATIGSDVSSWINDATNWVVNTFDVITSFVKNVVSYGLLNPLQSLFSNVPWWLMAAVLLSVAATLGGRRALAATAICGAIILGTGLWYDSMQTLAMTIVATVLTMVVAIVLGVAMGRSGRADLVVRPVLDTFQTIPSFVYLVPALALFGASRFTAIVAGVLYAFPVATKLVADGIRGVSETTLEATRSVGTTTWQTITKVQVPMARPGLILATNQGLLYVLSIVVIGGLVGAGSLGYFVVAGFSQQNLFGKGFAAAIAITAIGVMLDRIMRYAAARQE